MRSAQMLTVPSISPLSPSRRWISGPLTFSPSTRQPENTHSSSWSTTCSLATTSSAGSGYFNFLSSQTVLGVVAALDSCWNWVECEVARENDLKV